jgi:hypothetical protein
VHLLCLSEMDSFCVNMAENRNSPINFSEMLPCRIKRHLPNSFGSDSRSHETEGLADRQTDIHDLWRNLSKDLQFEISWKLIQRFPSHDKILTRIGVTWLIIMGSGLDDWIYWHFYYNYNQWVSTTLSVPCWTTSFFHSTVTKDEWRITAHTLNCLTTAV